MLRLSKKLLFALEAVVDIAYHAGPRPARAIDISRRQGIPRRYLEQVLQELVRQGILSGQRGPRGGYRLARERRRITMGEVVRVVRNLEAAGDPAGEPDGSAIGVKVVRPIWNEIQHEIMKRFDTLTVEELCNRARSQNIASEAAKVPDFSI